MNSVFNHVNFARRSATSSKIVLVVISIVFLWLLVDSIRSDMYIFAAIIAGFLILHSWVQYLHLKGVRNHNQSIDNILYHLEQDPEVGLQYLEGFYSRMKVTLATKAARSFPKITFSGAGQHQNDIIEYRRIVASLQKAVTEANDIVYKNY